MSAELQANVKAFLAKPLPAYMVGGSIAEGFLAAYAQRGQLELDAESAELLGLCLQDSLAVAAAASADQAQYLRESAELLQAILGEAGWSGTS